MIVDKFNFQNGICPLSGEIMILRRSLAQDIQKAARYFPVIAILGPRQSGKTTLAQHVFAKHTYITLEDLDIRAMAKKDPRTFLLTNNNEFGVIIDEFQYVPELLSYIQTIVDKEQKTGYFILTGSQNFLMNEAITQSLAGRVSVHTLLPLAIEELENNNCMPQEIEEYMVKGSYPAIYAKKVEPERLYSNYLRTYVERDIRQLAHVGDLATFQTFIALCAARVGQLLNVSSLGNECGISDTTAKRWLAILEASYIIFLLRPYHANINKRLVKTPKLYFYDSGLLCHLLRIKEQDLAVHPNRGNIFESIIISEIIKWHYNRGKQPSLYFWRDKIGHEVDCMIVEGQKIVPIEIKAGRTSSARFFEGLEYWNELTNNESNNGYVVYAGSSQQIRGQKNLISWQAIDTILSHIAR